MTGEKASELLKESDLAASDLVVGKYEGTADSRQNAGTCFQAGLKLNFIKRNTHSCVSWLQDVIKGPASDRSANLTGGFKLWECGIDLAKYLIDLWDLKEIGQPNSIFPGERALNTQSALELGCGHGLPGIVAARTGMQVHFQARSSAFAVLNTT